MTDNEIIAIIKQTETKKGFIGITNYRNSKGYLSNYIVTTFGDDAYPRLLKKSIEEIETNQLELPSELHGMKIHGSVWDAAIKEQVASWKKSLDGGHNIKNDRTAISDDDGNKKQGFYQKDGIPYLFNVSVVKRHVTEEQEKHNAKLPPRSTPKSPKAAAKDYLRSETEVGKYRSPFKLDPENFSRLAFSGTAIEIIDLTLSLYEGVD